MTIEIIDKLYILQCANCACTFGMPNRMDDDRRKDGKSFYCPHGHSNTYGEGTNAKLQRELNAAKMREQAERDQRAAAEAERDKLKSRVANGSCPCCRRNFKDLHRHMKTKHPDYVKK
jgi:hypothetical protein